mgnify:CR=1 FL=1
MRLDFIKGREKFDRLMITRADGTVEQIDCPKQRIIPHDMVHFAVEETLLADAGFLGRVAAGEAATFRMDQADETDAVERLVETIQADAWSGGTSTEAEIIQLYGVTCDARGCAPIELSIETVTRIRERVLELTEAWDALTDGGILTLKLA